MKKNYSRLKEEVFTSDLANLTNSVLRGENIDEENIIEWINCDTNDPGFEQLIDEQIVNKTKGVGLEESEGEEKPTMQSEMSHDDT